MPVSVSRRRVLQVFGGGALAGMAGCLGVGGTSDGDLVVRNEDTTRHSVTAIFDRGADAAYQPWIRGDSVPADDSQRFTDALPGSDWNYPFLLHVYVDSDYVRTTEHRRDDEIVVRIESAGTISATESEHTVPVESMVRTQTHRNETSVKTER